jgi:hypothetical protein
MYSETTILQGVIKKYLTSFFLLKKKVLGARIGVRVTLEVRVHV